MKIRFKEEKIIDLSNRFEYQTDQSLYKISRSAKEKKYLTKQEFSEICAWKTPRSKPRIASNQEEYIKEISKIALTTNSDQLRIEILTLLNGVGWPTASTILHFCHVEEFPILDFRALYSLGYDSIPKKYTFQFWKKYTDYCRHLSKKLDLDLRTIDRGLWQYSKENQNKDEKS